MEAYLDQPDADLLSYSVLDQVRNDCGKNFVCLYNTYEYILRKLENRNEYWLAIPMAEEMIRLAQEQEDLAAESKALKRLIDLKLFIGEGPEATRKLSDLIDLYEQMGDQGAAIETEGFLLEGRIWNLGEIEEVLPMIEGLRQEAVQQNLTETANSLLIRLKYIYEEFGFDDKLENTIKALEEIQVSDTIRSSQAPYAFHAASGRADLLMKEKKFEQAKSFYKKALSISRLRYRGSHDFWSEMYVLLRLAKLEMARKEIEAAKSYLDTAYTKSQEYKLPDRAVHALNLQIEIAESEKRFADALQMTREVQKINTKLDSNNMGFDLKKYHLQLETKQLMAEKEKQDLALQLKGSQLRYSFIIVFLFVLLALGLFFGLWKQRQGKRELAVQNQLIQQQAEQLKSLDAAKSRFFANVSHELRTPLTLMLGPVRTLLKDQDLSEKQSHLLGVTERSGQRLQQLIKEILDLRKLEMGKMKLYPQPTRLNNFFTQQFAQFESLAESSQIDFSYQVVIEKNKIASLDQEKCRQLLSNLLSNAFKFTPHGGQIKAVSQVDNGKLMLEVTDTGPGIHPDDLPHLFDRYFQTNRPDQPAEGGTGIGLALCKEYAALFGGEISAESTLGKGSAFTFRFPITLLDAEQINVDERQRNDGGPQITSSNLANVAYLNINRQAAATPFQPGLVEGGAKLRPTILVVEDNPDLRAYLQMILSQQYEVVTAENGQQALELLNQQTAADNRQPTTDNPASAGQAIQLILSDLMMPVMDGFQLLEQIKSNDETRHLPFVMLTARADMQDKLKALRIGVDDYLVKPFEEEELLVRIENLLQNQALRLKEIEKEEPKEAAGPVMSEEDQEWLAAFETYVQKNIANDLLDIQLLAQEFAMSQSTLLRQMKRLIGMTPNQYLQEVRLNEARKMLENQVYNSITKVAEEVGYTDTRSFSRRFKKRFGKLPSEV